jgi:putative flippase GtrA
MARQRLARFGGVGVIATLVHSAVLILMQVGLGRSRA